MTYTYYINPILNILKSSNITYTFNPITAEITTQYIIIDLQNKLIINTLTGEIIFDEPFLQNGLRDDFFNYIEIFPAIYSATKYQMEGGEE